MRGKLVLGKTVQFFFSLWKDLKALLTANHTEPLYAWSVRSLFRSLPLAWCPVYVKATKNLQKIRALRGDRTGDVDNFTGDVSN